MVDPSQDGYPGVTVSLDKGGVGKSVIALNIADRLAKRDNNVVLVDFDHDGHLTSQLGYEDKFYSDSHVGDILFDNDDPETHLCKTDFGVNFLPSTDEMESVRTKLKNASFPVLKLRKKVVQPLYEKGYDYFIIDVPGGRGKLSDNALVAVQKVIIPLTPETGPRNALKKMMNRQLKPLREEINIQIVAISPNKMSQTIRSQTSERELIEQLNTGNFKKFLPEYARISEEKLEEIDSPGLSGPIPKPGIRKDKAIDEGFRNGVPASEYNGSSDEVSNFDILADMVEGNNG